MRANRFSSLSLLFFLGKWLLLAFIIAVLAGTASAFFLFSLQWATATREAHRWLIGLLPLAVFAVGWIYLRYGTRVEAGNNLILEEIHDPQRVIPLRMAPLVFFGTVVSHLFGASVGREGTAVQMGASIADRFTALFRLNDDARRMILMAGISAGFSSVFGTPLAGERYIGLGIPVIVDAFQHPLAPWDCFGKLIFTVVSLGSGFKGGEVTPLFYVGATLGNALAPLLHMPPGFLAGIGFVAVFAGAANTPIASTLMAIELFGAEIGVYAALACVVAWLVSGYTGIYRSQRIACLKQSYVPTGIRLAELPAWYQSQTRRQKTDNETPTS